MRPGSESRARIVTVEDGHARRRSDRLATEEPLEIRVIADDERRTLAVTMRTPGADFELAAGFLFTEGVVAGAGDIARISYCVDRDIDEQQQFNIVNVALSSSMPDIGSLERHFYTSSSCGVCGKASLDALRVRGCSLVTSRLEVDAQVLYRLPDKLRRAQDTFESTGGLHAAGLFDARGDLVAVREDVGRHNAVDKLVGWALLEKMIPLREHLLMVSGRASFEIMQKALAAGIPLVCAVSAPSSLAVDVASEFGMTLVWFLRAGRFNVYSSPDRVRVGPRETSTQLLKR